MLANGPAYVLGSISLPACTSGSFSKTYRTADQNARKLGNLPQFGGSSTSAVGLMLIKIKVAWSISASLQANKVFNSLIVCNLNGRRRPYGASSMASANVSPKRSAFSPNELAPRFLIRGNISSMSSFLQFNSVDIIDHSIVFFFDNRHADAPRSLVLPIYLDPIINITGLSLSTL